MARNTPDDTDYVDFVLFETKVGYCNNFSTSMSVMLRSIGIPIRLVKGFTQGEVNEQIIALMLIMLIIMYVFKNRYYLVILISMTVFKKPFYPIYQLLLKQLQSKVYREPSLSLSQHTNQLCTQ